MNSTMNKTNFSDTQQKFKKPKLLNRLHLNKLHLNRLHKIINKLFKPLKPLGKRKMTREIIFLTGVIVYSFVTAGCDKRQGYITPFVLFDEFNVPAVVDSAKTIEVNFNIAPYNFAKVEESEVRLNLSLFETETTLIPVWDTLITDNNMETVNVKIVPGEIMAGKYLLDSELSLNGQVYDVQHDTMLIKRDWISKPFEVCPGNVCNIIQTDINKVNIEIKNIGYDYVNVAVKSTGVSGIEHTVFEGRVYIDQSTNVFVTDGNLIRLQFYDVKIFGDDRTCKMIVFFQNERD
jgi:hypothetical protein